MIDRHSPRPYVSPSQIDQTSKNVCARDKLFDATPSFPQWERPFFSTGGPTWTPHLGRLVGASWEGNRGGTESTNYIDISSGLLKLPIVLGMAAVMLTYYPNKV